MTPDEWAAKTAPYAKFVAKRVLGRRYMQRADFVDLQQFCHVAIVEALPKWRPDGGATLASFAYLCAFRKAVRWLGYQRRYLNTMERRDPLWFRKMPGREGEPWQRDGDPLPSWSDREWAVIRAMLTRDEWAAVEHVYVAGRKLKDFTGGRCVSRTRQGRTEYLKRLLGRAVVKLRVALDEGAMSWLQT